MTTVRSVPVDTSSQSMLCDKIGGVQLGAEQSMAGVSQLLIDLQRLSEDHEMADIVFLVDRSEERIYAHKVILNVR